MTEKNWKKKTAIGGIAAMLIASGNLPLHLIAEDTNSPAPETGETEPSSASAADTGQPEGFHIIYQPNDASMGSVSVSEETGTVNNDTGTVSYGGSEAKHNDGYQFISWTAEENGADVTESEKSYFAPSDVTQDITYTANFAAEDNQKEEVTAPAIMLAAADSTGINLSEKADGKSRYITGAQISWQNGSSWTPVSSETLIPLNTPFRITVYFSGISTKELRDNYSGILYYDIPSLLKDPYFASNKIMNGSEEAGTISASGNRITIQVNSDYLDKIINQDGDYSTIQNASFTFMATPDPDQVRQNYTQALVIGDVSTELRFNSDYDSENGTLTLQKSDPKYSEDANGNSFLQYTLTIATGNAAMPDVTVTDHFTQNEPAVEEYIGITDSSLSLSAETQPSETISGGDGTASQNPGTIILSSPKTDTSPGSFTWTIGAMRANETRTLTYQVKLRSGYAGAAGANNGVIKNTATPASGSHQRSSVTSAFTPKAGATVSKNTGTITINTDTVTIPYIITVTASSTNTWTLRNVKISDDFGAYRTNLTKDQLKSVLLDNNGSWSDFRIYSGTDTSGNAVSAAERASEDSSSSEPYYVVKPSNENLGFNLYIGDLPAGESKTITFNVKLRKTVLDYIPGGTASSSSIQIGNRAGAYSDDTNKTYGNQTLGSGDTSSTVSTQQWDRKVQGTAITDAITQTAPDSFYSYSDNAWKESNSGESITIPAGSIQYQVAVNEKGLWNVSSTTFTDALSSNGLYLNYAGYLRLDYYSDGLGSSASFNSDQEAVNALSRLTPSKTAWLKIDSMTSFSFTPISVAPNSAGTGAYLLTYYAKPVNTSSYSKTTAGNSFKLSGTVIGPGGTSMTLSPISVSTSTLLSGSKNFSVSKSAWYGNIQDTSGGFSRGSLYWIITASGTEIPAGLQLQDIPGDNQTIYGDIGTTPHVSIAGVYLSSVENADALTSAYTQISQIQNNNLFTVVSDDNWTWSVSGNAGTFTFNKVIDLNNQQLYIIVRTEPKANAFSTSQARPTATFSNSLSMRNSSNESYTSVNSDSIYIAKDGTNFKEVGEFGNYDATSNTDNKWSGVNQITGGNDPSEKILSSWTAADGSKRSLSSGTYIDYRLVVNYAGNEEGTLRLEDVVPEGMEPVYVRYFWTSRYFWNDHKGDTSIQPEIIPITDLGDNWIDIGVKNAALDGNAGAADKGNLSKSAYGYYDSASGRILIDVSNLTCDTQNKVSTRDIQIQIVMRITDPEVLKGTQKTFSNTMNVYTTSGSPINSSSTSTSLKVSDSIAKSGSTPANASLQRDFTITVNPRGEDLLEGSDTLTLADKLSSVLEVDLSTLHVKESADAAEDVPFTVQMDTSTNTMTLVIPDNKKLIITYRASISAPLGSTVNLSNDAYWYGYTSSKSGWSQNKVSVDAGGSVSFGSSPIITIKKADSQNIMTALQGAQFSLYETTYSENGHSFSITGNPIASGTTNAEGIVSFGTKCSNDMLHFNKVYGIVETAAPTGYIRSSDPVYVGIFRAAQVNGKSVYPKTWNPDGTYSGDSYWTQKELDSWKNVSLYYTGGTYTYTWPNSRTSVLISKNFYDGTSDDPVTFPSGDFRFGLYYGGQLLQTLTISNANGKLTYLRTENGVTAAEDQPLFTDLNTNDVYTIAELDDHGNQIANATSATINGETYTVTYPNGSTTFSTTDAPVQPFSISNRTSVTISGTKTWDDANNQDRKRPDSITVKLLADEVKVAEKEVTAAENWEYSFTGLPVYKNSKKIKYAIAEAAVENYSTTITGYNITNKYTPQQTSLSVLKRWNDSENQDGKRPNSVTVQLLADGNQYGDQVTLNSSGNWMYTWTGLPMYKDGGTPIQYTVKETSKPAGYTSSITGTAKGGYVITNSYTPETTTIAGTKTWDDAGNQDGKRPGSITVRLLADGKEVAEKAGTSDNNWKYEFTGLPKYQNGKLIDYTITEDAIDGYSTEISGYDITNSYTPGETCVTVTKAWNDNNDQDGIRPKSIQVQLYADGKSYRNAVTLTRNEGWSYTWEKLPLMQNGKEISYTVQEVSEPEGYTATVTGDAVKGFTITNTHTPEIMRIVGTKTWDDNNNQDGKRPDSITVRLLANGNEIRSAVVNSSTSWAYSFSDLPKYEDGKEIIYSVTEDAIPEYSTEISGFNITNTHTLNKTSLTVTKVWDDHDNQDGKQPESIQVHLYADDSPSGDPVTLTSQVNWTYTWENLDEMSEGKAIAYTVKEVSVPDGYTSSITGDAEIGYRIINVHEPETTEVSGTKTWNDADNQDRKRPDHITVKLLADGNEVRSTVVNSSTSWAYSFNDLPKYRDGHEISYSVIEDAVPDYSTEITGYDITNSYTPGKTSVTVTKVWDDGNNQDGIRPESVQVQLYADGKASGDPVTLNSDGNWTYTWDNLDQMKSGTEIVYTAEEVTSIDGYTSSVSGNAAEGFTITNHHTPAEKTTVTEDTNSSGGDSSPSASTLNLVPDTADHTDVLRHGITAILSLTTALIAVVAYKRYQ